MKIIPAGERLVDSWKAAQDNLQRAKSSVNKAECDLSNATNELSKFLLPSDAVVGEIYCVWFGDSLISATIEVTGRDPVVKVRKRGKSLI